jgi:hypothetical protein
MTLEIPAPPVFLKDRDRGNQGVTRKAPTPPTPVQANPRSGKLAFSLPAGVPGGRFLPAGVACSLAPLLPRSLAPSLPCSLAPLLPRSLPGWLAPSLPCSLVPSLPALPHPAGPPRKMSCETVELGTDSQSITYSAKPHRLTVSAFLCSCAAQAHRFFG